MDRKGFLTTWGYLQTLKDILGQKAKDVASKGGNANAQINGRYLQTCAEISAMQAKIDDEVEAKHERHCNSFPEGRNR